jgi:hypothetical protein
VAVVMGAGLGFITSMAFIFLTGVFMSSWLGGALLWLGERIIQLLPVVKHVYSAVRSPPPLSALARLRAYLCLRFSTFRRSCVVCVLISVYVFSTFRGSCVHGPPRHDIDRGPTILAS